MEKLKKYQTILCELVENFAQTPFSVQPNLENQVLYDLCGTMKVC